MKYTLLALLFLAACASGPEKKNTKAPVVKNEVFKKPKTLTNSEISDFFQGNEKAMNPALQDETMDRFSAEELESMKAGGDPLVDMSVRCSQKDFKGAFEIASKTFNQYQKVAPYWNVVANCHLNQGSYRKALLFYNKALEVSPNYVPALNNIGVMYSRQGQEQKALVAFERANKQSKFSKTPRYNMAKLYLTYGMAENAQPVFESLLTGSPNDVDLLNATAASHFLMSDYNKALGYFQRIPQSQWNKAEIGLNLALTLKKTGKAKEARQVFAGVEESKNANLKRYYSIIEKQLGDAE
jgi:tetratricopeptide (TPR) repeat protein